MGTRSVVARVEGDGFVGRYCHWDGYPTCRGRQLFQSYRDLAEKTGENESVADALIRYAIREGESGYWSSFCPPSENPVEADRSTPEGEAAFQANFGKVNWAHEADNTELIHSSGDSWGTEWAYVIADKGLTVFVHDYKDYNDTKDTGYWRYVGTYPWSAEPSWEEVESLAWPEEASVS